MPIRLAAADDALAIACMSRDLIERGLGWTWQPRRVRAAVRDPERNVAVTGPRGVVLAFGIMHYGDARAHLELMAVHPAHRRAGLGSAILAWLEAVARTAGMQRIVVECRRGNTAARSFYLEHGYAERAIAPALYRGVEDGIRLHKWLRTHPPRPH